MDLTALFSAILFFIGNLLIIIFYAIEAKRQHFDYDLYKELDPAYIEKEWKFRTDHRAMFLTAGIINAMAWFFFAFPMIQLAWILSKRGSSQLWLHVSIAILVLFGSFTEWISRFLYIGSSMATQLLYKEFNLDNWLSDTSNDGLGWRTLEVTHIVTSGLLWFVDAFEWLAMFFIMLLVHVSVRRWRTTDGGTFGACWNAIGLFIALLSLLDFVAEILRLDGFRTFNQIAFWYAAVNRLILLPTWLILLGLRLPFAVMKLNQQKAATTTAAADNQGGGEQQQENAKPQEMMEMPTEM
jgi:hypothetical protein